jgi:uncharacterized protein
MIGRAEDVKEIATSLEQGVNLVVAGPRRTGKTSVCDAALTRARGRGHYVSAVDLFRLADAAELAESLVAAAVANRSKVHRAVRRARLAGRAALTAAQAAGVMRLRDEMGEAIEIVLTQGLAQRDPQRYLDLALRLPDRIAQADGKRAIVFFDEFQEVASPRHPYGDPDALTKRMRAIFQRTDNVSYLFAGSLEHVMRDLFAPERRAFSGFGSLRSLRSIETDDWRAGLRERFESDGCEVDPTALGRLVEVGEGHPRATMLIAQQTHLASVLATTREIDVALVEVGLGMALTGDEAALEETVTRLRGLHRLALLMARRVAAGETLHADIHPGEGDRALKALRDAGLVERRGRGVWVLTNPLLRRHLLDYTLNV